MEPLDNTRVHPLVRPGEHSVDLKIVDVRTSFPWQGKAVALQELPARFQ
jgi:hypothetical protein